MPLPLRHLAFISFLSLAACASTVDVNLPDADAGPVLDCPEGREQKGSRCEVREIFFAGGTFTMGRGECYPPEAHIEEFSNGLCELSDAPHEVTVGPFYLDATEVVQGDIDDDVDLGCPTLEKSCGDGGALAPWRHSIASSKIEKAAAFCASRGKRLVTEAEWEFAASAGGTRLYPWGDDPPSCYHLWIGESCGGNPYLAGLYPPSPEGVYDLAASAAELVIAEPGAYFDGYSAIPAMMWPLPGTYCEPCKQTEQQGLRGGSNYLHEPSTFRAAHRDTTRHDPTDAAGFRCARNAEP